MNISIKYIIILGVAIGVSASLTNYIVADIAWRIRPPISTPSN